MAANCSSYSSCLRRAALAGAGTLVNRHPPAVAVSLLCVNLSSIWGGLDIERDQAAVRAVLLRLEVSDGTRRHSFRTVVDAVWTAELKIWEGKQERWRRGHWRCERSDEAHGVKRKADEGN